MFDPYHKWLGIPREEQPPNHYRLLGIALFESDPEVIDAAANRQMAYLQGCATGTQALLSQRLLNEVAAARLCLLTPEKKATYDARATAKRSVGSDAHAPTDPITERVPAPSVRRNTSDKRFPVLEGIDEEAKPYEVMPLPVPSLPRRSYSRKKKSRLPVVASILVSVAALLVTAKTLLDWGSGTSKDQDIGIEERNQASFPGTVEPEGVKTPRAVGVETAEETRPSSEPSYRTGDRPVRDLVQEADVRSPGEIRQFTGHGAGVLCVAFTPDGKYAVTGSRDRTVRVWDFRTGEEVRKFEGHEMGVWGIALTTDQHRLASCGPDSTVRLWDFDTGKELRTFRGHTSWVGSVLITKGGSALISSSAHSDDPSTRLWESNSGGELQKIALSGPLALSPDGELILIGGYQYLAIWNRTLRVVVGGFGAQQGYVSSVGFSPDGRYVVSSGGEDSDYSIRLWDASTRQLIRRFVGHQKPVNSVAFSPDGKRILSCGGGNIEPSADMTLRVWDIESGNEVCRFVGHRLPVKSVTFSPDGKLALSGSEDGTARIWRLPEFSPSMMRTSGLRDEKPETKAPVASDRKSLVDVTLFNGRDLTGWAAIREGRRLAMGEVFRASGGELVSDRSGGGYLRTNDSYGDFVLHLEYKFPKGGQISNSGSGVLLVGDEPGTVLFPGIECQVMPGQTGDLYAFPGSKIGSSERTPNGIEIIRKISDAERPIGEWNDYEIRCEGPKITLALNGRVVNQATSDRPIHNRIGLMCQVSDIRFRNIRLRTTSFEIPASVPAPTRTPPAPPLNATAFNGNSYMFFAEVVTWHEAKARCEEMGGHLATIQSRGENEFVLNLARRGREHVGEMDGVWLGATDEQRENHWRWVDGSKSSYSNWASGQPNNKNNEEHYLLLWLPKNMWVDQPNASRQHVAFFVCEWD